MNALGHGSDKRTARRPVVAIVLTGSLGLLLLGLAVPRTIAAWAGLGAVPAIDAINAGRTPSPEQRTAAQDGLEKAVAWTPSARRLADLGLVELEQAMRLPADSSIRSQLLDRSESHILTGLAANPADGTAWLNLAQIRDLKGAPPRDVALALVQSMDVAPNARNLWLLRAELFLRYWRWLAVDELVALRAQLRAIWREPGSYRRQLLEAAQRTGQVPMIGWAIGDDREGQREFERAQQDWLVAPTRK